MTTSAQNPQSINPNTKQVLLAFMDQCNLFYATSFLKKNFVKLLCANNMPKNKRLNTCTYERCRVLPGIVNNST